MWPIITGESIVTAHEEIILGYNFTQLEIGAIIMGDYKLIVNNQPNDCDSLVYIVSTALPMHCVNGTVGENCDPHCLYNVTSLKIQVNVMNFLKRSQRFLRRCLRSILRSRGICRTKGIMAECFHSLMTTASTLNNMVVTFSLGNKLYCVINYK